jgi:hypothetical protein
MKKTVWSTDRNHTNRSTPLSPTASSRPIKIPGPDHPIYIASHAMPVGVTVAGRTIADARHLSPVSKAKRGEAG